MGKKLSHFFCYFMKQKLESLTQSSKNTEQLYTPEFFYLSNSSDKLRLSELIDRYPFITVFDELLGQVEELIKSKNPKIKFTKESLTAAALQHIGTVPIEEYGVWVYYPWATRLVHILTEEDFVFVRTNRNQYKITPEEEEVLATKKIGVIGLSVGKAIALTIAMERICGEIRIADFDDIELSNLNRIQTGVQNFGIKKTIVVAREIAEIDPYLKVTIFSDGLTEENANDFYLKGGKLDICIEVCDGLYTKIFSRQKAKQFGIPVVMNSSDKGTTDVERYDLNPEMPLLHGLIDHLDLTLLKQASTNEEKIPYLLPMLGVETSSTRLKASMLEIGETITTWPQLASGVILGGGICTDVCRRILLNQLKDSGRYFVDLEEIICDKKATEVELISEQSSIALTNDEMAKLAFDLIVINPENYIPSEEEIKLIVDAATKAPSQGNRQPWKWYYSKGNLFLFHDPSLSDTLLDFEYLDTYISLGAASENLILKAHEVGLNPSVIPFPNKNAKGLVSQFIFLNEKVNSDSDEYDYLVKEIDNRHTNRNLSERQKINSNNILQLQKTAASINSITLKVVDNIAHLEKLASVVASVERCKMLNQKGHRDFVNELRWSTTEVEDRKDGIDLSLLNLSESAKAGLLVTKKWNVINLLKGWGKGNTFEKLPRALIMNSSAIGVITINDYSPLNYFNAGRSIQRTWLAATSMNLSIQPLSAITSLYARSKKGNGVGLDEDLNSELNKLNIEFENILDFDVSEKPIFLFRVFIADKPKLKSLRRRIENVFTFKRKD